jgi:hypothetical protein
MVIRTNLASRSNTCKAHQRLSKRLTSRIDMTHPNPGSDPEIRVILTIHDRDVEEQ